MNVCAKTLLSSYRYLERMANAIDKIVYTRAINSFFVSGSNLSFNSVNKVSDDILSLTERKVSLINLKLIIDEAFQKISAKHSSLLICVFIENRNCYQSCEALQISLRTFFRRQNQAIESFSKALLQLGYTSSMFDEMLKNENWIKEIKVSFLNSEKKKNENENETVQKAKNESENLEKKKKINKKNDNMKFEIKKETKENSTNNVKSLEQKKEASALKKGNIGGGVNLQTQNNLHF